MPNRDYRAERFEQFRRAAGGSALNAIAKPGRRKNLRAVQSGPAPNPEDGLAGLIERVTFHNEETGFAVLRIMRTGETELFVSGRYFDEVVRSADGTLRFQKRDVVCDSHRIDTLLALPL